MHRGQDGPGLPPRALRMVEQYLLYAFNGIDAADYYELGLYRRDLKWQQKREYVGQSDLTRLYSPFNRMAYRVLATDKVIFHLLAQSLNMPVPPIVALYTPQIADLPWRTMRTVDDLRVFLLDEQRENLFFKIDKGSYGQGALSLGHRVGEAAWVNLPFGDTITFDEVAAYLSDHSRLSDDARWIIQDRLPAHPQLMAVIEGVTPTLRIMTLNHGDGRVELNGAVMRFGDGKTPADNSGTGGVVFVVDEASGKLGQGVYSVNHRSVFTDRHPVTGAVVSGTDLPYWREAADLAIASARKLPQFVYLGWDVVITADGPLILEVNAASGVRSLQKLNGAGLLSTPLRPYLAAASGITRSGVTVSQRRVP